MVSRVIKLFFLSCMYPAFHVFILLDEYKILNLCNKIYISKDLYHLLVDCFFQTTQHIPYSRVHHKCEDIYCLSSLYFFPSKRICICTCDYNVDPICNCYTQLWLQLWTSSAFPIWPLWIYCFFLLLVNLSWKILSFWEIDFKIYLFCYFLLKEHGGYWKRASSSKKAACWVFYKKPYIYHSNNRNCCGFGVFAVSK